MKKILFTWILFFVLHPGTIVSAQGFINKPMPAGVTLAGDKVKNIYIPPPDEYYKKAGSKNNARITVLFQDFPSWAEKPVNYAVSILETLLPSDANIIIQANWTNITTTGVLANSSVTGYVGGWVIDALKPYAYYPVTLAEKIYGSKLNDDLAPDIELNVSSAINWYTETDGKPLSTQYDLVTIILHELIHGLGFFDSYNVSGTLGYYGSNSIPVMYDTFVENNDGKKLTDTLVFTNPSVELKNELTGGKLFFNGPLLNKYTQGGKAQLYAPSKWASGSSISHLDEDNTLDVNALMTPYIDKGEAIHDPGKFTMSILGDLGWINTRIIHEPLKDTEENLSQVTINASIKSDTAYNHNSVGVVYSFDQFKTSKTAYLAATGVRDEYTGTIKIPGFGSELQYYLTAEDVFHRIYRLPSFIDFYRYSVFIGIDTVKPVLVHTPADYYLESVDTFRFNVYGADNIGIDTVYVQYKINDGPSSYLGLNFKGDYLYSNYLEASSLSFKGGDSIKYRIIAYDKANTPNVGTLPASGFYAVSIEDIGDVVSGYSTDFSNASPDFFCHGFTIQKPAGFTRYGLHSKHPYESPEADGDSIVYVAMLRNPVRYDANGLIISYKDLALVEPGADGAAFGSADFYDYVVVEGSVDLGRTWFSLAVGYDCRYQDSWETLYNNSLSGQNSTATGNESLLVQHTLFPVAGTHISAGDNLMIRFRLYSDPYAYGWGWVIEDLHIGPVINSVQKENIDPLIIYPNPGNGSLTIKGTSIENIKHLKYSIFNSSGTCIVSGYTQGGPPFAIDISDQPSGIYFIRLYEPGRLKTYRYTLIR